MNIIECQDLVKHFKNSLKSRVRALDGVSLEVRKGEIFGLLGPNGAGKTTLVKIMLGLVFPTSGRAAVLGTEVKDWRVREKIGYLPENPRFPSYLNGGQMMDLFGKLSKMASGERRSRTVELLKSMKIDQWTKMKTKNYSKGMAQRLGLAQALISDPEIVFLDEPTDGVDPIGRHEIRSVLVELRQAGKTIFLNSHLLSEVEMLCDRVVILDQGRVVGEGTLEELTSEANRYRIKCGAIKPKLLKALNKLSLYSQKTDDDLLELSVGTLQDLNQVIDLIRKEGLLIESVEPVKHSLESYFIKLIEDVRAKGETE